MVSPIDLSNQNTDNVSRKRIQSLRSKKIMHAIVQNNPNTTASAQTNDPIKLNFRVNPYGFFLETHCLRASKNPANANAPNAKTINVCKLFIKIKPKVVESIYSIVKRSCYLCKVFSHSSQLLKWKTPTSHTLWNNS